MRQRLPTPHRTSGEFLRANVVEGPERMGGAVGDVGEGLLGLTVHVDSVGVGVRRFVPRLAPSGEQHGGFDEVVSNPPG